MIKFISFFKFIRTLHLNILLFTKNKYLFAFEVIKFLNFERFEPVLWNNHKRSDVGVARLYDMHSTKENQKNDVICFGLTVIQKFFFYFYKKLNNKKPTLSKNKDI